MSAATSLDTQPDQPLVLFLECVALFVIFVPLWQKDKSSVVVSGNSFWNSLVIWLILIELGVENWTLLCFHVFVYNDIIWYCFGICTFT